MGLFSRRSREPVVHPTVDRWVYVAADADAVRDQLAAYSELHSPKHATEHTIRLSAAAGWTAVDLSGSLHPWTFHNVAYWLLDTPGVGDRLVAVAGAGQDEPGYRLVRDDEVPDALAGWDDAGVPWTVNVPMNLIVKGDPVPVPASVSLPEGLAPAGEVTVLLEDPGRDMNPGNEATIKNRKRLKTLHHGVNAF